jgi:iron complex transport system substrate-binding protein
MADVLMQVALLLWERMMCAKTKRITVMRLIYLFPLLPFLMINQAFAALGVNYDLGNTVTVRQTATRIISLAPHITELVFAAGGARIIGAVNYSDYPEAAKKITVIGDSQQLDIERIIALKPDLIVAWPSGNSKRQLEQLGRLGIPIFYSEPRKLDDIASNIIRLGQLMGTAPQAKTVAATMRRKLAELGTRYAKRPTVRVFYQVWDKPLYTLNGQHIINDVMRLCGGENIFASLKVLAPSVSIESVLQANPEAILGGSLNDTTEGIQLWRRYPSMTAVRHENLFPVNADLLSRSGPRLVDGATVFCENLEQVRQHRKKFH